MTGLYSLRARYYNPALGMFLNQDMASILFDNPIELNRYGYTANNPINYSDPSGRQMFEYGGMTGHTSTATRMFAGAVGGAVFGGIGAFVIYFLASQNACGAAMKNWADSADPCAFALQSMVLGALLGAAAGGLPPVWSLIGGGVMAGLATGEAIANPNLCTIALAVVAWVGMGAAAKGGIQITGGSYKWVPANGAPFGGGSGISIEVEIVATNVWGLALAAAAAGILPPMGAGGGNGGNNEDDPQGSVRPTNRDSVLYPRQGVEGYGDVPFPDGEIRVTNPEPMRARFTTEYRMQFRNWWYEKYGWYPSPDEYQIHHIQPLSRGGTNSFEHLVPLRIGPEHTQFTKKLLYGNI